MDLREHGPPHDVMQTILDKWLEAFGHGVR
jgi:hypothetical protein